MSGRAAAEPRHTPRLFTSPLTAFRHSAKALASEISPATQANTASETVVSSANFHMENDSPGNFRSLIITKNSQGPKRVPCGTKAGTFNSQLIVDFKKSTLSFKLDFKSQLIFDF